MNNVPDLEKYTPTTKEGLLKKKILAYLAILLTLISFIFSCVGLNMGRQVSSIYLVNI